MSGYTQVQGIAVPFSLDGNTKLVSGLEYYRQSVQECIMLSYFEMLMEPRGSKLEFALFETYSKSLADAVALYISEALVTLTAVVIDSVDVQVAETSPSSNALSVRVLYRIVDTGVSDLLSFNLPTQS